MYVENLFTKDWTSHGRNFGSTKLQNTFEIQRTFFTSTLEIPHRVANLVILFFSQP
jgi:hypothetical protein